MRGPGLLGDTTNRAYAEKLQRFNRFARPEIEKIIDSLPIDVGEYVLDAGCGAGMTTEWLARRSGPSGLTVGLDLSGDHVKLSRDQAANASVLHADLLDPPLRREAFDFVWVANTINHLEDPSAGLRALTQLLRVGGRMVAVQSHFLPEMIFAWDADLERAVTDACHRYYREKYSLDVGDLTATRRLVGVLCDVGLVDVRSSTIVIERQQPLSDIDRGYLLQAIFRGYWGTKVEPYLKPDEWRRLQVLCDPESPDYCLARSDFHYMQTLTAVSGVRAHADSH